MRERKRGRGGSDWHTDREKKGELKKIRMRERWRQGKHAQSQWEKGRRPVIEYNTTKTESLHKIHR